MSALWYIDKHDNTTFTSDPEQAVTVKFRNQIVPVVAPGYVNRFAREAHSRQLKLWEHLLDVMELEYDAISANCDEKTLVTMRARVRSLEDALAILGYGNADAKSLSLIKAQAKIRYEESMEE